MPTLEDVYQRRWNNFDVLRFGLAAAVIWSHCYALAGLSMDPVFAFTRQIDAGSLAVDCFFVLSGFLITQSWVSDPTLGDYVVKRALRLVPALVVALAFGTLIVGPMVTREPLSTYFSSWDTWAHFEGVVLHRHLGSPLLFPDNPLPNWLNTSLWSLRYEVFCYALIAGVGLVLGKRWLVVAPLVLLVSVLGQMLFAATGQAGGLPGVPETTFRLVACFFAGSTLFVARERVPFGPPWPRAPQPCCSRRRGSEASATCSRSPGATCCCSWPSGHGCRCSDSGGTEISPTVSTFSRIRSSRRSCR